MAMQGGRLGYSLHADVLRKCGSGVQPPTPGHMESMWQGRAFHPDVEIPWQCHAMLERAGSGASQPGFEFGSCVILGKLLSLSVHYAPHLRSGNGTCVPTSWSPLKGFNGITATDLERRVAGLGSESSSPQVPAGPACTVPQSVGLDPSQCWTRPPHPPEICFESRREWSQNSK